MKYGRPDYDAAAPGLPQIPDDEPVFLIRGQDPAAFAALVAYSRLADKAGASGELIESIKAQAEAMEQWQAQRVHTVHTPDL